jgi:hypothetical protein
MRTTIVRNKDKPVTLTYQDTANYHTNVEKYVAKRGLVWYLSPYGGEFMVDRHLKIISNEDCMIALECEDEDNLLEVIRKARKAWCQRRNK